MYGAHVAMKFLARIQTLGFRRQAMTLGCGLIVGWLKDGWDPLGMGGWNPVVMLEVMVAWYFLVVIIGIAAYAVYHGYLAGPEDQVTTENFITIVSLTLFIGYLVLQAYEKGWLPRSEDYD